jgi:hypothetical protein
MGGVVGAQSPQSGGQQSSPGTGKYGGIASQGGGSNPFQQYQGAGIQQASPGNSYYPQTQQQPSQAGAGKYGGMTGQQSVPQGVPPEVSQQYQQQRPFQVQQPNYGALFGSLASMFGNQQGRVPFSNYQPVQSANNFQLRNTYQFDPATDPSRQYAARVKAEADQKEAEAAAAKVASDAAAQSQTQQTSYEMGSPGNARGGRINSPNKKIRAALLTAKGVQAKAVPGKGGGGDVDYRGLTQGVQPTAPQMARRLNDQGLYSHAAEVAAALPQAKGSPQQMKATLKGVKQEELAGFDEAFGGRPSVTRDEMAQHFNDRMPQIETKILGGEGGKPTQYSQYTLPGGENYREMLLKTPENPSMRKFQSSHWKDDPNVLAHLRLSDRTGPSGEKVLHVEEIQSDWGQQGREEGFLNPDSYRKWKEARNKVDALENAHEELVNNVLSPQFQLKNPKPTRKEGESLTSYYENVNKFHDAERDFLHSHPEWIASQDKITEAHNELVPLRKALVREGKTPTGPYVGNTQAWTDLALKAALKEAAHGNYDRVAWTQGHDQANRYGLIKNMHRLAYDPEDKNLSYYNNNDGWEDIAYNVEPEEVHKHIGKEAAEKLLAQPLNRGNGRQFLDVDMQSGGEGMKSYYDKIVPNRIMDVAKKAGAPVKVEPHKIDTKDGEKTLHSIRMTPELRAAIMRGLPVYKAGGSVGDPQALRNGGSPDDDIVKQALERVSSPFSQDPKMIARALETASSLRVPQNEQTGPGSYYSIKQPMAVSDVTTNVLPIPGVTPASKKDLTWEDFYKQGKGGTFINLGGDRSNLGRLTHINNKPLAWPVDLHAGPKYMTEPNPGLVWANNPNHATALRNKILEAAEKGPVYGVYAPMGTQSVDSSHNMFDTVMAQIPGANISKNDAEEFDKSIKNGLHVKGKDNKSISLRKNAIEKLEKWPGILNAKEASEFARNLPGGHRSAIIKYMDSAPWQKKNFPAIGVTRVAITDPELKSAFGNMLGHRIVRLDPESMVQETAMKHSTYTSPTGGEYVGDVPLVQRHYAAPDVVEKLLRNPTKSGEIVHPYSVDKSGRSTFRKLFL